MKFLDFMTRYVKHKNMKIGILGGSFDPPHLAHKRLAEYLIQKEKFDQLWVFPCKEHAFGKTLQDFSDRFKMCELNFDLKHVHVKDDEKNLSGFSIDLIRKLKAENSDEFIWVGGEDLKERLSEWKDITELKKMIPFLFLGRSKADFGNESSSEIRRLIHEGKDPSALLDPKVWEYIQKKRLYR